MATKKIECRVCRGSKVVKAVDGCVASTADCTHCQGSGSVMVENRYGYWTKVTKPESDIAFRMMLIERADEGTFHFIAEFSHGCADQVGRCAVSARKVGWQIQTSWTEGDAVFFLFIGRRFRRHGHDDDD